MNARTIFTPIMVILLLTLLFAGLATVPAAAQGDTMQFRYNAQRTGDYGPVAGHLPSNGHLKWSYTTGLYVASAPAVANGAVFVGSGDGNVYALNATTGTLKWIFPTGSVADLDSPAVVAGVVYVGSANSNVYALNATTGTKLWNYTTDNAVQSSPAVVGGVVYIGSRSNEYALDATTGNKLWNAPISPTAYSSPAVANGVVYVGSEDNNLYALNANDGTTLWKVPAGLVESSPAVVNGVVYVGSDNKKVYALDAATGAERWNFTTGDFVGSSPAVANGVVYVGSGDAKVYALDASTGVERWNHTTGGVIVSSPAFANGVVYIGSNDKNLYALDAATGAERWNFTTGDLVESSPAVFNCMVFVGSDDGNVYALGTPCPAIPTTLTATISVSDVAVGKPFTVCGVLTAGGTGVAGATIQLQRSTDNGATWADVAGKTATTDANGAYCITTSESAAGRYVYRTTFAGATIGGTVYAASTSPRTATVHVIATPTVTPTVTPTIKPTPVPPIPYEVPGPAVICAEVCDANTLPGTCEARPATPSPTSSFTLPSNIPLPPIPGVPEFPLAGAGAGVVGIALAGIYAVMRKRL